MPIAAKKKPTDKVIDVPVLPHVACVLRKLHGKGIIDVNHNTLIGKVVANCFMEVPDEFEFPERPLSYDKVQIGLNYRIYRFYKRWNMYKVLELGIFYEKIVLRMMVSHIIGQTRMGATIKSAIDDFFDLYDIDESDYARKAATDFYNRFKNKINEN